MESKLKILIKEQRFTNEHIIDATGIHRNRFYIGLKNPVIFNKDELKAIAEAIQVTQKKINEVI